MPERPGLRPTSDRVRETLFNWLQPVLPGARALDAFAGSGALGLEAASRGAAEVVLVERDPALAAALRATAGRLDGGERLQVVVADALAWLGSASGGFDVAFLDPPFAAGLLDAAAAALAPLLAPGALVYVERGEEQPFAAPPGWLPHREGRTRDVRYALYRAGDAGTLESGR
ncbi:16S rRNA (guanine(966)-N(2))-methyltransferase RsmD [Coralloluteibacterium thermophilus]|uniref:Ribosomal RNA small subunit methyltransferase D n=1 Tax=Coralloluteibacterium thermophilum TaxID=2707049 RepID=A0ABV9NNJ2_9GAMM